MSSFRRRAGAGLGVALALAALATPGSTLAAANWTVTRSPASVQALSTATFSLVATNTGSKKGSSALGCIRVSIPSAFTVQSTGVTNASGHQWSSSFAASGGSTTVTVHAAGSGQRLSAQKVQSVSFTIRVTAGPLPGAYQWMANAFTFADCTATYGQPVALTVTIGLPVNLAPVALPDVYAVAEDGTLAPSAPGVLANDVDADGDPISAQLVSGPAHGSLSLAANGSFSYKPAAEYSGTDSFTYRANDGTASSLATAVTINVTSVNDPPLAVADAYTLNQDVTLSRPAPGVLANDVDPDSPSLSAQLVTGPAHGSLSLAGSGAFTYTPAAGYSGADSFRYRASDGASTSAPATVSLTIVPSAATPAPTVRPTPASTATPTPSPSPTPRSDASAGASGSPDASGNSSAGSSASAKPALIVARGADDPLGPTPVDIGLTGLGANWFIPAAAVAGPGLLVIVAIALQLAGALAWLPAVRRYLGSGTRRSQRQG